MKIAFFGTSDVAAVFLEHLLESPSRDLAAVVTTPDRRAGRGLKPSAPPVKTLAASRSLTIFQPDALKASAFADELARIAPDVGVVVSYGKLIPPEIYSIPAHGCLNVHFSFLPEYRGAAPIQRALMDGARRTGVSVFFIRERLDDGPLAFQRAVAIEPSDDYFSLRDKLVAEGKKALDDTLAAVESGTLRTRPQDGAPSWAPAVKKTEGRIDWYQSSVRIANLVRALVGWPTAYCFLPGGRTLAVLKAVATPDAVGGAVSAPGTVTAISPRGGGIFVACGGGVLEITEVRPQNSRRMTAAAFAAGRGVAVGDILL